VTATFKEKIREHVREPSVHYLLTAAPVGADAKHSFPVLDLFHSNPTWEIFSFAPVSTAGETPETSQAEPPKLAQVKALPQLEEDIPNVQCDRANGVPEMNVLCTWLSRDSRAQLRLVA
jgi:hypothetical protein